MPAIKSKPSYGVDAPGVIRNLFLVGIASILLAIILANLQLIRDFPALNGFWSIGAYFTLSGILMLVYSLYGKYKHRDRILNLIRWSGTEQVLDVGTGKGLLLIGAAKKLTTGKATGIDIWNAEDLTGNTMDAVLQNATIEGVREKIDITTENVTDMHFPDETFDVVISNLCIHNIYSKAGRSKACEEIKRVLKPGGTIVIADFRHVRIYRKNFAALGLKTTLHYRSFFATFPPITIVKAEKSQ